MDLSKKTFICLLEGFLVPSNHIGFANLANQYMDSNNPPHRVSTFGSISFPSQLSKIGMK